MSKKFEYNRFKNVVKRDGRHTYSIFGIGLMIISLMPLALWAMSWSMNPFEDGIEIIPSIRISTIRFLVTLAIALAPMVIYKSCNLQGRGNYFAMLPASHREKFLSMLLYCFIVAPLVVLVGACAVDTLLTVLPVGPYKNFLWENPPTFFSDFDFDDFKFSKTQDTFLEIIHIIALGSLFMFTNTVFKKGKFIKTVLWFLLVCFVIMVIAFPLISANIDKIYNYIESHDNAVINIINLVFWIRLAFNVLIAALFIFLTGRRLKRMQY